MKRGPLCAIWGSQTSPVGPRQSQRSHRRGPLRTIPHSIGLIAMAAFGCLVVSSVRAQTSPVGLDSSDPQHPVLDAKAAIDRATCLARQGDAAAAVKVLADIPASDFKGKDADFRACMLNRFGSVGPEPAEQSFGDPWINSLATEYLAYWKTSLTRPEQREQAERELRSRVSKLLGRSLSDDRDFDAAEDEIRREALKRRFYILMGRTPPLRELMLWKKLTVEQRQVNLPWGHRV